MAREVDYDTFIAGVRARKRLIDRFLPPARRTKRARHPDEELALTILDLKRWERALAEGRIERTGPREFRFK